MPESELNLKPVTTLNEGETLIQIIPFGGGSLACFTSASRVLVPGKNFGEWFELPTPPPFSSTGK